MHHFQCLAVCRRKTHDTTQNNKMRAYRNVRCISSVWMWEWDRNGYESLKTKQQQPPKKQQHINRYTTKIKKIIYIYENAKQEETAECTGLNTILLQFQLKTKWSRAQINQIVITRNERKHAHSNSMIRHSWLSFAFCGKREAPALTHIYMYRCLCACRLICSNIVVNVLLLLVVQFFFQQYCLFISEICFD